MKKRIFCAILVLSLIIVYTLAACSGGAAAIHLRRTQGTVSVSDGGGKDVPVLDNLGLYSGYGVNTRLASYAWIDLDDVKLAKLDQNSEIIIGQEGKALSIELKSGSLFFNVTEPLADDETMSIRTSTMLVGIRGTCGWVEDNGGLSRVYLLAGKVESSAGDKTVQVNAGEFAELTADGELTVKEFSEQDLPAFVREEVDGGADEASDPVGSEAPEPTDTPEPTPEPTSEPTPEPEFRYRRISDYSPDGVLLSYSEFDYDESGRVWRQRSYSPDGIPEGYDVRHYDELGRQGRVEFYRSDGEMESYIEETCDEQNRLVRNQYYDADGTLTGYSTFVYNEAGQMSEVHDYTYFDGIEYHHMSVFLYNDQGLMVKEEGHSDDGERDWYLIYEYDGNGLMTKATYYDQDGAVTNYTLFEYI